MIFSADLFFMARPRRRALGLVAAGLTPLTFLAAAPLPFNLRFAFSRPGRSGLASAAGPGPNSNLRR